MGLGKPVGWLVGIGLGIGQTNVPRATAAEAGPQPAVTILFDHPADLSHVVLGKAQIIAEHVFRQAGVRIRWIKCSFSEAERLDPPGCQLSRDTPTLIVQILSDDASRRWQLPARRLGFSLGSDVYLVKPGIVSVAQRRHLPMWLVLGHVLVHEAGHVLLGPGHSQGILRPDFSKSHWRQAEKGQLLFAPSDARRIREALLGYKAGDAP